MEFHYQRVIGAEGGVSRASGQPPGARLATVLADGLPPLRVALEMIAAFCGIVYIAHDDGEAHGDLGIKHAWINGDGVVSLGGFGLAPRVTTAPEGKPAGPPTDLYGLGTLAAAVLVPGSDALGSLPRHSLNAHDDRVASFVMPADLDNAPDEIDNDLRWYLLHLLSFDRARRPTALKTWRSFIAFARTVTGASLQEWAADALRGGGARRDAVPGERLGGARGSSGPLTNPIGTFSSETPRTTYWMPGQGKNHTAADELVEPEEGGGEKTGHWTREQLLLMAREASSAPKPQRQRDQDARETLRDMARAALESDPVVRPAGRAQPAPTQPLAQARSRSQATTAPVFQRPDAVTAPVQRSPPTPTATPAPRTPVTTRPPQPMPPVPEVAPDDHAEGDEVEAPEAPATTNPFANLPDWAVMLLVAALVFFLLTFLLVAGIVVWYFAFGGGG